MVLSNHDCVTSPSISSNSKFESLACASMAKSTQEDGTRKGRNLSLSLRARFTGCNKRRSALKQKSKERVMYWQRWIFTTTVALVSLTGEISNISPAAAASHYPLWVCGGRYGGWGWSRPAGLFGNLTFDTLVSALANPHRYEYRYPAYSEITFYYPYPETYCLVSYTNGWSYSTRLR